MSGALAGYRVLELAHFIAGPVCGLYLADMGADVIKVEEPGGGDASRGTYDAATVPGGDSSVYLATNRNKRSVAVDLTQPEGRGRLPAAGEARGRRASRRIAAAWPSGSASATTRAPR